jgi:uncharacterized protein
MGEVPGQVGWHDLTVPDAGRLCAFYQDVVGWTSSPLDVGGYDDFVMRPAGSETAVAGICHARGTNAALPPAWLIYFIVADLDASISACVRGGGEVIAAERRSGEGRYCVIRDPAGAVAALYERTSGT